MARLIAARRTAVVPRGGAFARLSIEDLAAPVLLACLADAGIDPIRWTRSSSPTPLARAATPPAAWRLPRACPSVSRG